MARQACYSMYIMSVIYANMEVHVTAQTVFSSARVSYAWRRGSGEISPRTLTERSSCGSGRHTTRSSTMHLTLVTC